MRRFAIILATLSLAASAIWFGVWTVIAGRIDDVVANGLADAADQGLSLSCDGQEIGGFPLRFDVICGKIGAMEAASGIQVAMAGLRTATPLYRPWRSTADLVSPLRLSGGPLRAPVDVTWSAAEISLEVAASIRDRTLDRIAFSARGLQVAFGEIAVTAGKAQTAARAMPDRQGAALVFSAAAARLLWQGRQTDAADITAEARINAPPDAVMGGAFDPRRAGLSIPEMTIRLETADALIEVSGPVRFNASGQINGKLKVHVVGADALPAFIRSLPDAAQPAANAFVGGVLALGTPVIFEGREAKVLVLAIDDSVVRLGPIALAHIPPLF